MLWWAFPGGPVVKTLGFHCRGSQVRSFVRELRFHMLSSKAKKIEKIKKIVLWDSEERSSKS